MKNEALYNKTVNILVQAYFNDTLVAYNCFACAVGNIIAANMGYKKEKCLWRTKRGILVSSAWASVHTIDMTGAPEIYPERYNGLAKEQIDSTGYSYYETSRIEVAFEKGYRGETNNERMFNGLMAVVDVLDEIHENNDAAITSQIKELFVKA